MTIHEFTPNRTKRSNYFSRPTKLAAYLVKRYNSHPDGEVLMSTEGSRILNDVLALPVQERAELVERILDSLGEAPDKERLERWAAETESRLDAIERGELETVPGEEVLARLRQR
jgi:putative addiction module component (TIGR02574 family)